MRNFLRKHWLHGMIIIALPLLAIQFIGPGIDKRPVTGDIAVPDSIKNILKKACYDCHSNETKLSWFDKMAPASWLVARDIREGRKVLNFSEWDRLTRDRQKGLLIEALNQVQFKAMPLHQYTFMHPSAKMGTIEINSLQSYLSTLISARVPDTARTRAWNEQYELWIKGTRAARDVKPAPNGIAFMAGYKDWVAISSTERMDDGRLRVIMGNDIAVNAIKINQINPWPDGSAFAKIAWNQVVDSSGIIHAGEFTQVAFMVKDKDKYSSTLGWGFAQWVKGTQLAPYGKNALFATECVNCHKPMKDNDFVFTLPLDLTKEPALEDRVICSLVNKKEGTMSTLYGNEMAKRSARGSQGNTYPPGSVLTLVTWTQKKDIHWSEANIPGTLVSLEKIRFGEEAGMDSLPVYEKYGGNPLRKREDNNLYEMKARISFIVNQRASVMP
jgi:hypothetical protein